MRQVDAMRGAWEGQIVVTSVMLSLPFAHALLEAGALAVVCKEAKFSLA